MIRSCRLLALFGILLSGVGRADYMDHFAFREDVGPHKVPYLGPAKLLVIPVEVAGAPRIDVAKLERFFGPDEPGGFVDFYRTASLGRYLPVVSIAPVVHYDACPLPEAQFPGCAVERGDIAAFTPGMALIRDVVHRADLAGVDFSQFDVNGRKGTADGYADGVMILTNIRFGGIAFPFAYYNRDDNLAGGMGGPLIVDGVKIPHVAIAGEGDARVLVHEFGHLLGLTDLYDESGQYDGLPFSFMGAWDYDPNIPLPDAETRYRLRWANVVQVEGEGRLAIPPVEASGQVFRLGTGTEYFLVENRGPGGRFDGEFTARGLVVYHVDRSVRLGGEEGRFVERLVQCVECDPWHPYIRVVQADGRFDLEAGGRPDYANDLFGEGDVLRPDPGSTPLSPDHRVESTNLYSGAPTGWRIDGLKVLEDGTIEASFSGPPTDPCADPLCEDGEACQAINCAAPAPDGVEEPRGCGCA
ncbi:MAG: hypothetical protein IRZ16_05670, partial [Myxococcaceae bacterium]|nr:hypothetical protein [Myxococcaceae bacterium]